jgi:hypothetical protein
MSESPATPEQPTSETAGLQRMREMTAGVIAILVVGGLFVLTGWPWPQPVMRRASTGCVTCS